MDVSSRLGDDWSNHGDRNTAPGRFRDVDVVGRDRRRADSTQFRVGGEHGAIDTVVQQRERDVTF
jgi:hypothetical protein